MLDSQIENITTGCMSLADKISVPKEHEWQEIIPRCYSIRDIMRFNCVRTYVRLCYGFTDLTELMQEVMAQEFAAISREPRYALARKIFWVVSAGQIPVDILFADVINAPEPTRLQAG